MTICDNNSRSSAALVGLLGAEVAGAEVPCNGAAASEASAGGALFFALSPPLQIEHVGPNVPDR